MRLAGALAVALAALAFAAPAQAIAPPPTVLDFEGTSPDGQIDENHYPGVHMAAPCLTSFAPVDCGTVTTPGHDSAQALTVDFSLELTFDALQSNVSMWVNGQTFEGGDVTVEGFAAPPPPGTGGTPLATATVPGDLPFGGAAVLRAPGIGFVRVSCDGCFDITVDDVTFSPFEQPDTEIVSGPASVSRSSAAGFVFVGNQPDSGFECRLDGAAPVPCRPPFATGVGPGAHTLSVAMRDRFGTLDPTPAVWSWTVDLSPLPGPAPAPAPPDADGDGVPDASDNCAGAGNASQADGDRDGVGNACEVGGPGDAAPVTGESVIVRVLSGEVFVKLPSGSSRSLKQSAPISGFVPLKGAASLPIGTVVDARRGSLALESTVDGRRIGAGGRRQSAQIAAGIFAIRQRRLAEGSRARIPTDLVLQSAPGAEAACVRTGTTGPIKGRGRNTVRSLTTVAKGLFRTVGGAGIVTARDATWVTQDRCDGTRTDVGKGRVSVLDRETGRRVTVRAGRSYLVKAKLFAARRTRR